MKQIQPDTKASKRSTNSVSCTWRFVAVFIPFIIAALVLTGVVFIKGKVHVSYHLRESYRAGDVAVFVAMPFLNASVK